MSKFDSNAAWREASGQVAANRDVFFALAGVFFVLPSLALSVIGGEPEVVAGMKFEQIGAAVMALYAEVWWLIVLTLVLQVIGVLAILTLMRDRARPTVGEAIRSALGGTPTYLGAQLLFSMAVGLIGGFVVGIGAAVAPALGAVLTLLLFGFALFALIRLILVAPVIAVEGQRNPLTVLRRSWVLTRGQFWRIFGFLALVGVLFLVVLIVVMLVVGLILAIATSGETQRVLRDLVSSSLVAIAVIYIVGITAAIHRQLAGPSKVDLSKTFG